MKKCTIGLFLFLTVSACDLAPAAVDYEGYPITAGPYLLLDDALFENVEGVRREVQRPVRDASLPNPLITGVDENVTPFFSVLKEGDRFRVWYNTPIDYKGTDQSRLGYMESSDGIHWERPHRVLPGPEGGIRFGASVIPNPAGGYVLGYHQEGGLRVAVSEDGFDWQRIQEDVLIEQTHDVNGLTYDPIRKRWVAMLSDMRTRSIGAPYNLTSRETRSSVSTDLLHWEDPWDVLTPDVYDFEEIQFYAMDGFLVRGNLLIGMVKVLWDEVKGPEGEDGMGWTTLAWSRNGRDWQRDKMAYFEPDPTPGAWDDTHAWIDQQVLVGDTVYLYYAGYASGHKGDRDRVGDRQIGLLRIPRDRYAYWEAGPEGGVIRTRPLRLLGSRLTFNAAVAAGGSVDVQIVSANDGSTLASCAPITGDQLDAPLACDRPLSELGEAVRLIIHLREARLFAWTMWS